MYYNSVYLKFKTEEESQHPRSNISAFFVSLGMIGLESTILSLRMLLNGYTVGHKNGKEVQCSLALKGYQFLPQGMQHELSGKLGTTRTG